MLTKGPERVLDARAHEPGVTLVLIEPSKPTRNACEEGFFVGALWVTVAPDFDFAPLRDLSRHFSSFVPSE